jgi:hypothetical protein
MEYITYGEFITIYTEQDLVGGGRRLKTSALINSSEDVLTVSDPDGGRAIKITISELTDDIIEALVNALSNPSASNPFVTESYVQSYLQG